MEEWILVFSEIDVFSLDTLNLLGAVFSELDVNGKIGVAVSIIAIMGLFFYMTPFLYQMAISVVQLIFEWFEKIIVVCLELIATPMYILGGYIKSLIFKRNNRTAMASVAKVSIRRKEAQTMQSLSEVMFKLDQNRKS